jgi:tetratricopeptide (TPR) repeat protein
MGVVYAAYDPELERKIAIKLLHPGAWPDEGATNPGQRRLLREAQAMARLDHVNVVSVHDVGEFHGGVYVAMEFIAGETLAAWLSRERPGWQGLLGRFIAAGRGLSAAHAKGLVHRDFKPDNVMLGDDGRVRVMDFGLAFSVDADEPDDEASEGDPMLVSLETRLTEAGSTVGTPQYMAPEQHLREPVGPAADQFSFAVALWKAIYGEHPFGGDSRIELAMRVVQGTLVEPASGAGPRWLRRALERGLARRPEDRFASMDALLNTLQRGVQRSKRRPLWIGVGVLAAAVGVGAALERANAARREATCVTAAESIREVWSPGAREQLLSRIAAVDLSYAEETALRTASQIDTWVGTWVEQREASCRAFTLREEVEPEIAARADACFEERRFQLEFFLELLGEVDETLVRELVSVSARIPRVEPCSDPSALARQPTVSASEREAVQALRETIARADTLTFAHRLDDADIVAREALARAEALQRPEFTAKARLALGQALFYAGKYDEAETVLRETFAEAGAADAVETAAAAASLLTYVVGYLGARHDEGLIWSTAQKVYVERIEPEPGQWTAVWSSQRGAVNLAKGDYDEASALMNRALVLQVAGLGEDHPKAISTMNNVAAVAGLRGDVKTAVELQRRAAKATERAWGANHPVLAAAVGNLGAYLRDVGEFEESEAALERAIDLVERVYGSNHPRIAAHTNNLAVLYFRQGRLDDAEAMHLRTLDIAKGTYGDTHPLVGKALLNLSLVAQAKGDLPKATALAEQGTEAFEATIGAQHDDTLEAYKLLAELLSDQGLHREALTRAQALEGAAKPGSVPEAHAQGLQAWIHDRMGHRALAEEGYARALASFAATNKPRTRLAVRSWLGLAEHALDDGDPNQALVKAQMGLEIADEANAEPRDRARAKFLLARASQAATPLDQPDEALRLARDAAALLEDEDPDRILDDVRAWISAHGGAVDSGHERAGLEPIAERVGVEL